MEELYTTGYFDEKLDAFKPIKPPFSYYGSKNKIAQKIIKLLPPHNAWVEAFCGSASLTLAKKPVPIEIINDKDNQVVNLFEQLRHNRESLIESIALTPYARYEYLRAQELSDDLNDLEKARRFLIYTMMTINGAYGHTKAGFSYSQSYAREGREARVNRWYNLPDRLNIVADRLKNVRIENRDARDILRIFHNRPATLVYLDPPYLTQRSHKYKIDANDEAFHIELLEHCNKTKCMIVLSGYDSELYNKILTPKNGWTKTKIDTTTRDTTGVDFAREEFIWINRLGKIAFDKKEIQIKYTEAELEMHKVNPIRE